MPGRYTLEGVTVYMNLLERVLTLLGANLNTMIEKADDPEQVLRQLQLDMRNQLVQVKTQVATAIAESHKLGKRSKQSNRITMLPHVQRLPATTISSSRQSVTSNYKRSRNNW